MRHSLRKNKFDNTPVQDLLKILSLNLHKGFSLFGRRFVLHDLRDAIRSISADIVFLQEVLGEHDDFAARHHNWPVESQYEFLADEIWPNTAYGKNAVYPGGHHGNAILSKHSIAEYRNRDISEDGAEARGLLHSVISPPDWDRPLHVICVHLGLTERHRQSQLRKLNHIIATTVPENAGLVVAGDFNDWRNRANAPLEDGAGLTEIFADQFGKSARTFPAVLPLFRLDRIFVRDLVATEPRVLSRRPWSHLSDHVALAAVVEPMTAPVSPSARVDRR